MMSRGRGRGSDESGDAGDDDGDDDAYLASPRLAASLVMTSFNDASSISGVAMTSSASSSSSSSSSSSLSSSLSSSSPSSSSPLRPLGGLCVLDPRIVYASLHSPLLPLFRLDVLPFLISFLSLIIGALPALWYATQVWWLTPPPSDIADADVPTASWNPDVEWVCAIEGYVEPSIAQLAAAVPKTASDLLIAQLYVPDTKHFVFMYCLPLFMLGYGVLQLALYWSVKMQIALRYRSISRATDIDAVRDATVVRVIPVAHGGSAEVCVIRRVFGADEAKDEVYFMFQKTKYLLHRSSGSIVDKSRADAWFAPLDYPVADELHSYISRANSGDSSASGSYESLLAKYGSNSFDIPLPPFFTLFMEHAMSPFFVFQVFCVGLWCLDDYWYYSLMTLVMLVMFECTLVKRRLANLQFMRGMRQAPYDILVHRSSSSTPGAAKSWVKSSTSVLVPGDIVSLVRQRDEQFVVPADVLLLSGNIVVNESMLTGESVPQVKESLHTTVDLWTARLDLARENKINVVFGGTKVILANAPTADLSASTSTSASTSSTELAVQPPPDGGCIGFVLRTGFETAQGRLVRTILFSSDAVSINNLESLLFIGVLLVFALFAAGFVCMKGLEDASRSKYKLMLNCIMIITSVVPPELPMELSLAVNTSLLRLMRCNIFCTEPFRIPLAGAVDVCAFDKTGTLTRDEFVMKGIVGVATSATSALENGKVDVLLTSASAVPLASKLIIAGCHSLTFLPDPSSSTSASACAVPPISSISSSSLDHLIGDPLEKAALAFAGFAVGRGDSSWNNHGPERLRIVQKYPFSSALKRMSTIVALEGAGGASGNLRVLTKGAAEVLLPMFLPSTVPTNYTELHTRYSQQGCRVLALGWRELSGLRDVPEHRRTLRALPRSEVESNLVFGGFVVLQCPCKPDSASVVAQLKASSHQVMMISGDAALTCCSVAREVNISTKPIIILQREEPTSSSSSTSSASSSSSALPKLVWHKNTSEADRVSDTELASVPFPLDFTESYLIALTTTYDLCITGDALDVLVRTLHHRESPTNSSSSSSPSSSSSFSPSSLTASSISRLSLIASYTCIFARADPGQKESIIVWLKSRGLTTLMCGDGANDTGSLKQAHIGVALIAEAAADAARAAIEKRKLMKPIVVVKPGGVQKTKLQLQLAKLEADMAAAADEQSMPRLGDASIASPFTSKLPHVTACIDIIRQGRCTLVTTLQMFNILGVNCLISAYSMSVLYLDGVKWGDAQMTLSSLSIAMFFFAISHSEPLKKLSSERPHTRLFTPYMLLSVIGQFAIHMFVLLTAIASAQPHTPHTLEHRSPDKIFRPNVLNTVVYLVSTIQTVATFAANYRGRPFMCDLRDNKFLYRSLLGTFTLMLILASESLPFINTFLALHALPTAEFKIELMGLMLFDVAVTIAYAKALRRWFAISPSAQQRKSAEAGEAAEVEGQKSIKKTQ